MARTGTLITLTTKLSHPNRLPYDANYDRSISCCLVNRKIPYINYIWIGPNRGHISYGWHDVIHPYLRINYSATFCCINFIFNDVSIVFLYGLTAQYHHIVKITTSNCDMDMCRYPELPNPYINFSYINAKLVPGTQMKLRNDLIQIEKNQDLWIHKYEFVKLIYQLVVKHGL